MRSINLVAVIKQVVAQMLKKELLCEMEANRLVLLAIALLSLSRLSGGLETSFLEDNMLGSTSTFRKLAKHLNAGPWFNDTLGLLDIHGELNEDYLAAGVEARVGFDYYLGVESVTNIPSIATTWSFCEEKEYKFEACPSRLKEHVPCVDNTAAIERLQSVSKEERWERHCPTHKERMCCLIAAPIGYKFPIRWPTSRDEVWYNNVPLKQLVADEGEQNWIKLDKDKFTFPGGGTQFAHGASQYLDHIGKMIPTIGYGRNTRVALDIGCGVASFGAYLLDRDVITLSIAPNDGHKNQIQFALERGVPAMLAALATCRLPYPSQAFDLIHCSRCRIDWTRDSTTLTMLYFMNGK